MLVHYGPQILDACFHFQIGGSQVSIGVCALVWTPLCITFSGGNILIILFVASKVDSNPEESKNVAKIFLCQGSTSLKSIKILNTTILKLDAFIHHTYTIHTWYNNIFQVQNCVQILAKCQCVIMCKRSLFIKK